MSKTMTEAIAEARARVDALQRLPVSVRIAEANERLARLRALGRSEDDAELAYARFEFYAAHGLRVSMESFVIGVHQVARDFRESGLDFSFRPLPMLGSHQ